MRLSADRGFADRDLFAMLDAFGIRYIIRVKGSVKVALDGQWRKLHSIRFVGNNRRRYLELCSVLRKRATLRVDYAEPSP